MAEVERNDRSEMESECSPRGAVPCDVLDDLAVFLFGHAVITGGYPFYHPVELFCIRYGFLTGLLGLLASIVGKGQLRPHVAAISTLNLVFWFIDTAAQ